MSLTTYLVIGALFSLFALWVNVRVHRITYYNRSVYPIGMILCVLAWPLIMLWILGLLLFSRGKPTKENQR